jgi:DNA-binding winged helix-turn-helix (wHTH) protein/tetratricopeptide (TPR) repeat protein
METARKTTLILGNCTFELPSLTLRDASGAVLSLRSQSLRVLAELAATPGQLVSRDTLVEAVWPGIAVTDDSLVQCIKDIRGAIEDRDRSIVKTAINQGYILNARVASDPIGMLPVIHVEKFRATDGIAEELSEALFEELLVRLTPRTGIIVVTDPEHRSDAKYTISGRVSVRSGTVRIFFQIVRLEDGRDLHASTEQAEEQDIWNLPGQVSDAISAQLRLHMAMSDASEFAWLDDDGLSAQELLTKASWHMVRFQRKNWYAARAALEQAVLRAPDNPVALTMLASMETQMIPLIPFSEINPDCDRAMSLCERAVELDPSNDWVLRTRGNVRFWLLKDHEGARLDCRRALAINPSFHLAHLTIATSDIFSGAFQPGIQRLEEMMRRAPFDTQNPLYFSLISLGHLLDGQTDQAIAMAREGLDRNPLGAWNAMVYAVAAADNPEITSTDAFRRIVDRIDLAPSHFSDFPFTDSSIADELSSRAVRAGISGESRN